MANIRGFATNPLISGLIESYSSQISDFLWPTLFPVIESPSRDPRMLSVDASMGVARSGHGMVRSSGGRYAQLPFTLTRGSLKELNDVGLEVPMDATDEAFMKGEGIPDPMRVAAAVGTQAYYREMEIQAADLLTTTGNFTGYTATLSGSNQWSHASSNPVGAAETAIRSIRLAAGGNRKDIHLVVGAEVDQQLRQHPALVGNLRYTQTTGGLITESQVAQSLGLEPGNYHVGAANKNTAEHGDTEVPAFIWPKSALFFLRKEEIEPMTPGSGIARIALKGFRNVMGNDYMDPNGRVRYVQVFQVHALAVVAARKCYLYDAAVA